MSLPYFNKIAPISISLIFPRFPVSTISVMISALLCVVSFILLILFLFLTTGSVKRKHSSLVTVLLFHFFLRMADPLPAIRITTKACFYSSSVSSLLPLLFYHRKRLWERISRDFQKFLFHFIFAKMLFGNFPFSTWLNNIFSKEGLLKNGQSCILKIYLAAQCLLHRSLTVHFCFWQSKGFYL